MSFEIPASDNEKQIIHAVVSRLVESLSESAELAESLVETLDEYFVAIDKGYKKQIAKEYDRIGAAIWKTNVALFKMMQHKERIIEKE